MRTAAELHGPRDADKLPALKQAIEWLRHQLRAGPKEAALCGLFADAAGIANVTLRRAKEQLGVQSVRDGQRQVWLWQLPE